LSVLANENGPNIRDELNVIEEGKNYGWPDTLGFANDPSYTDPIHVWEQIVAPTGIHFYRGNQFPGRYRGKMFQYFSAERFRMGRTQFQKESRLLILPEQDKIHSRHLKTLPFIISPARAIPLKLQKARMAAST